MTKRIDLYKSDAISSKDEDQLGRKPFIEAVVKFIESQATEVNSEGKREFRNQGYPLTIGIYGKWGYGKTSVIRCVETDLKSKFFTAYYNPWMYNNEEDLIQHLFETVVSSVNAKDKENGKKLADKLKKYSLGFLKGFKARAKFGIPFTDIGLSLGYEAKSLIDTIEKDIDSKSDETVYDVKEQINEVLKSLSNPLVIFIDDIDRLSKSEVYTLFKTVRLIADFKNVIYMLSFDDEMVAKSIKEKFAGGTFRDGFDYLDKIIDLPLRLSSLSDNNIENFFRKLLDLEKNNVTVNEFDSLLHIISHYLIKSPRDCIRIVNSATVMFNMLNATIILEDLILIESLRLKSKDLFKIVVNYYESIQKADPILHHTGLNSKQLLGRFCGLNSAIITTDKIRQNGLTTVWHNFFIKFFKIDIINGLLIADVVNGNLEYDNTQSKTRAYYDGNPIIFNTQSLNRIYNPRKLSEYFEFVQYVQANEYIVDDTVPNTTNGNQI